MRFATPRRGVRPLSSREEHHGGQAEVRAFLRLAQGATERPAGGNEGGHWSGVATKEGSGPTRQRAFHLVEILPKIHLRCMTYATGRGVPTNPRCVTTLPSGVHTDLRCTTTLPSEVPHQRRQLATLWRPATWGAEEVTNQGEGSSTARNER